MAAKKKTNPAPKTTAKGTRRAASAAAKGAGRKAESAAKDKKVSALDAELRAVREERARTEDAWLVLADRVGDA